MLMKLNQRSEKGFTLIELMIVVAIIGILAAIAIPQFSEYRKKAFNSAANADLRNAMTAEEAYFADLQAYFALGEQLGEFRNATLALNLSKNVSLALATTTTAGTADYTGHATHTQGTRMFTVSGQVGTIRSAAK